MKHSTSLVGILRTAGFLAAALLVGTLAIGRSDAATTPDTLDHGDQVKLATVLRSGGHVVLVRHGATFGNQADTNPFDLSDISRQRNLNENGRALAVAFGAAIRGAGIPIGEAYTSQFHRAFETAVLAGFEDIETTVDLTEGGLAVSPDENNRRASALRALLAIPPAEGKNTVLITHKPNIIDALGKDWFDVKEGEASVFKPENGAYRLVARLQMGDWPLLTAAGR
jgi:phosphohistidine phosphatase SixA